LNILQGINLSVQDSAHTPCEGKRAAVKLPHSPTRYRQRQSKINNPSKLYFSNQPAPHDLFSRWSLAEVSYAKRDARGVEIGVIEEIECFRRRQIWKKNCQAICLSDLLATLACCRDGHVTERY
jgi:hypothetical protein